MFKVRSHNVSCDCLVMSVKEQSSPTNRPDVWCERSLYFFSVAIVVAVFAVLALMLLGLACLLCVYRTSGGRGAGRGCRS